MHLSKFLSSLSHIDLVALEQEKGIGSTLVKNISDFINSKRYENLLTRAHQLESKGIEIRLRTHNRTDHDISCAITGSFPLSRPKIQSWLESYGIQYAPQVTKKTTYVLVGQNAGSSQRKAEMYGIPLIFSIEDLLKRIREHGIHIEPIDATRDKPPSGEKTSESPVALSDTLF